MLVPLISSGLGRTAMLRLLIAAGVIVSFKPLCASADELQYHQHVEPILRAYCGGCHNDTELDGDFSLASYAKLMEGIPDGPVVEAGKPDQSLLLQLIEGHREPKMPPENEPQPKPADIEVLRRWIEQGAVRGTPTAAMSGKTVPSQKSTLGSYVGAACSVGNDRLALGGFQVVRLVESQLPTANDPQVIWECRAVPGKVNQLRLSPDRSLLIASTGAAGANGVVLLIRVADGSVVQQFVGNEDIRHHDLVYCASMSRDGRWLASGSYDRRIIVWDVASGKPVRELAGHNGTIYDLDFDPSSQALATASGDQTVKLWRVETGERLDTFGQPEGEMLCVRFSADGRFVYAAGADRQIRQWRVVTLDKPAINPMTAARFAHDADIVQMQWAGDGQLITASSDKTVKVWTAPALEPVGQVGIAKDIPVAICVDPQRQATVVDLLGGIQLLNLSDVQVSGAIHRTHVAPTKASLTEPAPAAAVTQYIDNEPNDSLAHATSIQLPAEIQGSIHALDGERESDVDLYRFRAVEGEPWIIEVNAARASSPLDSRIEILHGDGRPVLRTRLQAVRESYYTFRGKDSSTIDDFRLHKWEDMELDEYLYSSGEVVKLWLYPRGPDSGFKVYPGSGARHTYFDTTPISHALGEPAYIVRELVDGAEPLANGLPVFPIYFENDDDSSRRIGADSRLQFIAPETDEYLLRIRDARGFGSEQHTYQVTVRRPKPDFQITVNGPKLEIPVSTGREWSVSVVRLDGMNAPIVIQLQGLPPGIEATNPLVVESNQIAAVGTLFATHDATALLKQTDGGEPAASDPYQISLVATSEYQGQVIEHALPVQLEMAVLPKAGLSFRIVGADGTDELDELSIRPGETVSARVVLDRNGSNEAISFGNEDSGRGLPHGAFIDNIGLNGLLIPAGENEREFFITAAPKVQPGRYPFHLRSTSGGNPTSRPLWLRVK